MTVFLHRHQAHHALALHPIASHFFRFWLWLTTGMVTKEWAAVHRKHHAKCETPEDPHSPQPLGINRVLWGGVFLYVKEAERPETIERYGHGTPDDWLERSVYSRFQSLGLVLMGIVDVALFGIVPGVLVVLIQIAWIPFWAAGVINSIGHFWGYRHWPTPDASTNIVPIGILIGASVGPLALAVVGRGAFAKYVSYARSGSIPVSPDNAALATPNQIAEVVQYVRQCNPECFQRVLLCNLSCSTDRRRQESKTTDN